MTITPRSRHHIDVKAAPAPTSGYPAEFKLLKDDDYVKYGPAPFMDSDRRPDAYGTPEIITQTWYMAESGAIPISGAAPEIAKKSIAMPIEYAIPKAHQFLMSEGIREEINLMASDGLRTVWDVATALVLGADGAVIGTAELVALGCIRLGRCERGLGCPFGITTTDPEHAKKIDPEDGRRKIVNLYNAWKSQLAGILQLAGLKTVRELRGRTDLLVHLD